MVVFNYPLKYFKILEAHQESANAASPAHAAPQLDLTNVRMFQEGRVSPPVLFIQKLCSFALLTRKT